MKITYLKNNLLKSEKISNINSSLSNSLIEYEDISLIMNIFISYLHQFPISIPDSPTASK